MRTYPTLSFPHPHIAGAARALYSFPHFHHIVSREDIFQEDIEDRIVSEGRTLWDGVRHIKHVNVVQDDIGGSNRTP